MSDPRQSLRAVRRMVVKVGSNVLVGGGYGVIDRAVFAHIVQSIAREVQGAGRRVVLVSSGAVALGRRRSGSTRANVGLAYLQALAAMGQSALMQLYEHEFGFYDIGVGQVLLTQADIDDRRRFINARHTLHLLSEELGAIPIVNENDTVANEELRLGDNDRLAALVATLFEADLLLVLSDVEGLYPSHPDETPGSRPLDVVAADDRRLDGHIWETETGPGRGGMATKLEAARMAAKTGISTVIAPGRRPGAINDVLRGERVGTLFLPPQGLLGARRVWLLHGVTVAGRVVVDGGAVEALTHRGKSLLPSGIVGVEGRFPEGAAVDICGPDGAVVARGLVSYSASDIERIAGHNSREIDAILGYKNIDAVVHRDDLVLTDR